MRRKDLLPQHLFSVTLRGFEDDDKKKKDDKSNDDDAGDDEGDEEESEDKPGEKDQGNDGLKSALRKERQTRREYEKELKKLRADRQATEDKDKSDTEKAQQDATKAKDQATKLAVKLRNSAVDTEIIKAGTKLKFRDLDDALKLVDREEIDIDQDEDDPSEVRVDAKSVEDALKALAKAKPHLLVGENDKEKSGSKFNGGSKSQDQLDEEALKAKYPALRRGSTTT